MADLFAIVKRTVFEEDAEDEGYSPNETGFIFSWKSWLPTAQSIVTRLRGGGRVWAVTARPGERLWLVAVYENPKVTFDKRSKKYQFETSEPNRVPVTDITHLIPRIQFENGTRILRTPGKLAQGLQTIRALNATSVQLLQDQFDVDVRRTDETTEANSALEGKEYVAEMKRRQRDPDLIRRRLAKDDCACQHCGFSPSQAGVDIRASVVEVHHIYPLKDRDGEARTSIDDLLTLCPTCHRLAHAIATTHEQKTLDLKMLSKFYPVRVKTSALRI